MASKVMVVIGALEDEDHVKTVVKNVESGINKWIDSMTQEEGRDIIHDLNNIPKMQSGHNGHDLEESVLSRYRGRSLDTTILIGPTSENLHYELVDFFLRGAPKCFVVYGGFITEDKADWYLQDGLFSFINFQQIFKDPKVTSALSESNCQVTIGCCKLGSWAVTENSLKSISTESSANLEIMDISQESKLHTTVEESCGDQLDLSKSTPEQKSSNIEEFSDFLEDGIGNEIGGIFNTLKPPSQEGFLKIRNPCLYIFPGGHGDSAFFAVNGFNMLVNGGACTKPWFWKLIQHVDRVDSILATHLGTDNLPGLNSLLLRKLQERQVKLPMDNTTPEYQELRRCLISPDLGPLFINAPAKFLETISKSGPNGEATDVNGRVNGGSTSEAKENGHTKQPVLKTVDVAKDTMRLSKALNMEMVPLVRKPGPHPEPITLFSKVGLGHLEMYVVSPAESSKELAYINEKWGCNGKTTTPTGRTGIINAAGSEGDSTVTNLSSICCLLVWHPSNPNERIVRVLFPGNATQTKIFEGLESLKHLPFLKTSFVTKNSLNKQKSSAKSNGPHPQRAARPASGTAAMAKKVAATTPKKPAATPSASHGKREAASNASKPADKRPKTDKPVLSKTRPASASSGAAKSTSQKEKVQQKTGRPEAAGDKTQSTSKSSSSSSLKKTTTTRPEPKLDSKRPGPSATPKPGSSKPRQPAAATKPSERPKKQVAPTPKVKTEPRKSPAKLTTSTPTRKAPTKKSPMRATTTAKTSTKVAIEKTTKKQTTELPQPSVVTPPEDLTPEFTKLVEVEKKDPEKAVEPMSTGSEEPSTSMLSDRHTPEGEDVASVNYTEAPEIVVNGKEVGKPESDNVDDVIPSNEPIKEDAGFVVMNKPEISEESDFLSENGSSLDAKLQENLEKEKEKPCATGEADLISSDTSTPTPDEEQKNEKVICFVEPDKESILSQEKEGQHWAGGLERQPTPFHSLQESSGNTENSPLSEENLNLADIEKEVAADLASGEEEEHKEENDLRGNDKEELDGARSTAVEAQHIDVEAEDRPIVANKEEQQYHLEEPEDSLHAATKKVGHLGTDVEEGHIPEYIKDAGSEVHSSFNSSLEGSYELYPVGRSPPPASDRQETIAETISDFKHDEIASTKEFEDPSTYLDPQQQQVELLEDPTMSMETPVPPFSVSTTSTGSRLACMDSPYSPSEIGVSNSEYAASVQPHADVAVAPVSEGLIDLCVTDKEPEAECEDAFDNEDVEKGIEKPEVEVFEAEIDDTDDKSQEDASPTNVNEENLRGDDYELKQQGLGDVLDNQPQNGWQEKVGEEKEEEFDLHAAQKPDDYDLMDEDEKDIPGDEQHQVLDNEEYLMGKVLSGEHYQDSNINDNERVDPACQEEEDRMQMTGSLASSAQDQGLEEDYSVSTSLTETGATPEVEHPPAGFDYDGPNVKEYEQVEGEVLSKSDLSLSSPEENFPLHGGYDDGDLLELNGNTKVKPDDIEFRISASQTPGGDAEMVQEGCGTASSPQRYHPAYTDPSAPLADTEEGQDDAGQLKLDSPLDVHAKPFVPKGSVPFDQSPTYGDEATFGAGAHFAEGEAFPRYEAEPRISPPDGITTNPFMVDLLSTNPEPLAFEPNNDAYLPPIRGPDPCAAQDSGKAAKANPKKGNSAGPSRKTTTAASPVFVDLAYVPNHANKSSVGLDFFKKIRAKYYVISGNDVSRDEPSTEVLNHLLEGKRSWFADPGAHTTDHDDTNVTVIPTHDTNTIREWYQQNFKELESCNIHMVASGSKVLVQVESIEACKIEF